MKKNLFCLLFALAVMFSLAASAYADETETVEEPETAGAIEAADVAAADIVASGRCGDNLTWTMDRDAVLTITGSGAMYDKPKWGHIVGEVREIVLPEGLTYIGAEAFWAFEVTSIRIPASMTGMGKNALNGCWKLEEVQVAEGNPAYCAVDGVLFSADMSTLVLYPDHKADETYTAPTGLTAVAEGAFRGWHENLRRLEFQDGLTSIGACAFYDCSGPREIILPDSVTEIGEKAFSYCGFTSFRIPAGVTRIEEETYFSCSLTSIDIPENVTYIGPGAFDYCQLLKKIVIPGSVKEIGRGVFFGCIELSSVTLNEGLETIGPSAFAECEQLREITIPASVREIGLGAFDRAFVLENIFVAEGSQAYSSQNGILFSGDMTRLIRYPERKRDYQTETYVIPEGVTAIEEGAFKDTSISGVIIPSSLKRIDKRAFYRARVGSIELPHNVEYIGEEAFAESSRETFTIYNPNCVIYPDRSTLGSFTVLYGYNNSTAEAYVNAHYSLIEHKFEPLGPYTGFMTVDGLTYFYIEDWVMTGLITVDGKTYYASVKDGHIFKNTWVNAGGGKYYYCSAKDGHIMKGGRLTVDGKTYYVDKTGARVSGFVNIGSQTFYFSAKDGHLMKGGLVNAGGGREYYLSAKDGHVMKGGWVNGGNGRYYLLDKDGLVVEKKTA